MCCSVCGNFRLCPDPGEIVYSDHGPYWFMVCFGDCQDETERIDLMIAVCFGWVCLEPV